MAKNSKPTEKTPLVSIVITTRNEAHNIARCLCSIQNQTYPNAEVIVVDNNSTDKTKAIARKFAAAVFDKGPERSAQRNYGVKKSRGKYILYLDADMALSKSVVSECVDAMEADAGLAGIYIPERIVGNGFWIRVRDFERSFYDGTVIDCVRFVPKTLFAKAGGFDTTMTGPEDWDFDKKIRQIGRTAIIKSPLFHDEGAFDLGRYLKKKAYYSKSMDAYARKWGKNDEDVKKQLGAGYRLVGVFVEKGKWEKLISNPLYTIGMLMLRLMVGITYLKKQFVPAVK